MEEDIVEDANHVLGGINNYLNQLSRYHEDQRNDQFYTRLSLAEAHLDRIKDIIASDKYEETQDKINGLKVRRDVQEHEEQANPLRKTRSSRPGNRRYEIDGDHLEQLLSMGCSIVTIAKDGLLGAQIHPNTIHRFIKANGIKSVRARYSDLSDDELKEVIKGLNKTYPNSGIRQIQSMLKVLNPPLRIQRDRVAKILAEVDPIGATMRWTQVIPRRVYKVPTPNSLWHIDTHHKLIRWNFVTNGCVDGFSRLIVILQVHTDNRASSMLCDFVGALNKHGIPSRVRADKGGEFVHINKLMDELNGEARSSFMKGKSVHNVRIERLWRDIYSKVIGKYHDTFTMMEENDILDIDNDIHLSCLHYTYGRRIQRDLDFWKNAYNNHPLRTEKNRTPCQLWFNASMRCSEQNNTAMENLFRRNPEDYEDIISRYRNAENIPEPETISMVLPRIQLPLSIEKKQQLDRTIDVLRQSDSNGLDIYGDVMRFVF
eukprot:TCONS_00017811-protein